jgi:hypothetical protein
VASLIGRNVAVCNPCTFSGDDVLPSVPSSNGSCMAATSVILNNVLLTQEYSRSYPFLSMEIEVTGNTGSRPAKYRRNHAYETFSALGICRCSSDKADPNRILTPLFCSSIRLMTFKPLNFEFNAASSIIRYTQHVLIAQQLDCVVGPNNEVSNHLGSLNTVRLILILNRTPSPWAHAYASIRLS